MTSRQDEAVARIDVRAFSTPTDEPGCLRLHFKAEPTDADRANLLDAINAWNTPSASPAGREEVARIIEECVTGPRFSDPALVAAQAADRLAAADRILALAAPERGWRTMDTLTPRGQSVLLSAAGWDGAVIREWGNAAEMSADLANWINPPTHWQPCPQPPAPSKEGEL